MLIYDLSMERRIDNARSGALSAQILDFSDKLDPGHLEFLFFFTLDFAS